MIKSFDGTSFRRVGGTAGDRTPVTGFKRDRAVYVASGGETSIDLLSLAPQINYTPGAAQLTVKRSTLNNSPSHTVKNTLRQALQYTAGQNTFQDRTAGELRFPAALTTANFVGDGIISVQDDLANTRTKFTATRSCTINVTFTATVSAAAGSLSVYKNGSLVDAGPSGIAANQYGIATGDFSLVAGDFITIYSNNGLENTSTPAYILITAQAEDTPTVVYTATSNEIPGVGFYELTPTSIGFPPATPLVAGEVVEITKEFEVVGIAAITPRPDLHTEEATAGQTLVTVPDFSWTYNAFPAKRRGAVRVELDGQAMTRGIDYNEVNLSSENTNQIQFINPLIGGEEIAIIPTHQVIDTSAAATAFNGSNLDQMQKTLVAGTQGFVDVSSQISVPHTAIVNRAKIVNLASDLSAHMGVNRIMTQQITAMQNESGLNGEPVFKAVGDTLDQIRFVGNWVVGSSTQHGHFLAGTTVGDYVEVTFYGTGLNLLTLITSGISGTSYNASIDGGVEGANILPSSGSNILSGRSYSSNSIVSVTSGLTLGLHTVKIRLATLSNNFNVFGFETLNESSSVKVTPGTSYVGGKELVNASLASSTFNTTFESGTLGTRGGRVLVYQKSNHAIAKAVNPVNASAAYLASADHTNEEVVRTYHWREFGAGRADDFSTLTSTSNRAFTLDDGTTTLCGVNVEINDGELSGVGNGDFWTLTFVGCGVDIVTLDTQLDRRCEVFIDGVSRGHLTGDYSTKTRRKIASGLPYGTHTLKFVGAHGSIATKDLIPTSSFIIYQPKKPSLPAGAVELADYNVMGNYAASITPPNASIGVISQGVLRKMNTRETVYVGAGWSAFGFTLTPDGFESGWNLATNAVGDSEEISFFGTGIEYRVNSSGNHTPSWTFSIDGNANLTGLATYDTSFTGLTFTTSTGTLAGTTQNVSRPKGSIRITGLSLGWHKLKVLNNNGGATPVLYTDCYDIITPIHSHKENNPSFNNTSPVGSQSLADLRKFNLVKSESTSKAWAQAKGVASAPSTTSTVLIPVPDMSLVFNAAKNMSVTISGDGEIGAASGVNWTLAIFVNGVQVRAKTMQTPTSGHNNANIKTNLNLSAGFHKVDLYWSVASGTLSSLGVSRNLTVEEI